MLTRIPTADLSQAEWLNMRRKTIGGSDAGAICGMNPYVSPYAVYAEKHGIIAPKPDNEAMRQGRDFEEYVARRFCEETGKKVRRDNSIIYNSDYPYAHANVDRLIVGEDAGLECKTASPMNGSLYESGMYPDHYYAQCMHYLMVTGRAKWYLAVLVFQRGLYIFTVERDPEQIINLARNEREFYKKSIEGNEEPPVDGMKSTSEALNERFKESSGGEIDLQLYSNEVEEIASLKEQQALIKTAIDARINAIKDFMQTAERGSCGDHRVIWKTQRRKVLDKKRLAAEHPEIDLSEYYNESVTRPFKIN